MKTTSRHFEYFQKACFRYLDAWGIHDWEIKFQHVPLDGQRAKIIYDPAGRIATFILSTDWVDAWPITKSSIEYTSKHECIHLLLAPISAPAQDRFVTSFELNEGEHRIVNLLVNLLPEKR